MQLHTIRLLKLLEEVTDPQFRKIPLKAREQLYAGHPLSKEQKKWIMKAVEIKLLGSVQLPKVEEDLEDYV